jgi:RES domain-containing protein
MVYTSETLALAALEYLVHVNPEDLPHDLVATSAVIPDTTRIGRAQVGDLPTNWRAYPAPGELADMGSAWARKGRTAVLAVPSVVVPVEWNYLLSPGHADFSRIRIAPPEPFSFDPRLVTRARRPR